MHQPSCPNSSFHLSSSIRSSLLTVGLLRENALSISCLSKSKAKKHGSHSLRTVSLRALCLHRAPLFKLSFLFYAVGKAICHGHSIHNSRWSTEWVSRFYMSIGGSITCSAGRSPHVTNCAPGAPGEQGIQKIPDSVGRFSSYFHSVSKMPFSLYIRTYQQITPFQSREYPFNS